MRSLVPFPKKHAKTRQEIGVVRAGRSCSDSGSAVQTLPLPPLPTRCSESASDTWHTLTTLLQCEPTGQLGERQDLER